MIGQLAARLPFRRRAQAASDARNMLQLALCLIQLSVWLFPFPEANSFPANAVFHPIRVFHFVAAGTSAVTFDSLGPLALVIPLVAAVLIQHPSRSRSMPRAMGMWLGVALLLQVLGDRIGPNAHGGLVGAGVVRSFTVLVNSVRIAEGLATVAAIGALVWALGMGPVARRKVLVLWRVFGRWVRSVLHNTPTALRLVDRCADSLATWVRDGVSMLRSVRRRKTRGFAHVEPVDGGPKTAEGTVIESPVELGEVDVEQTIARDAPDDSPDSDTEVLTAGEIESHVLELVKKRSSIHRRTQQVVVRKALRMLTEATHPPTHVRARSAVDAALEIVCEMESAWRNEASVRRDSITDAAAVVYETAPVDYDFLAGMSDLKRDLDTVIRGTLGHADMVERITGEPPGGAGILLYGAPGCGKTYFALATAGEFSRRYGLKVLHVGIESIKALHWSKQLARIAEIFALAESAAPCVVIWDEFDAYASDAQKTRRKYDAEKSAIFKQRFEGALQSDRFMVHIATTNWPWQLELPLLRPGRLGIVRCVPPPDEATREELIELRVGQMTLEESIDIESLVEWTAGNTIAEIQGFLVGAAQLAVAENLADLTGRERGVAWKHFEESRPVLERRSFPGWLRQAHQQLGRSENAAMKEYFPDLAGHTCA